ncbi:MAG TPA: hypothetical protein VFM06_08950 [Candidatus Limnocylindria bacterium]|nr:hypothetical protein [Candidatus Limnocylindria bacterium]
MRPLALLFAVALLLVAGAGPASADDGDLAFRRTTPRAVLGGAPHAVVIGIPGGRAWGIESELRPLPPSGTVLVVRLAVTDDAVREAFVRVAYYGAASGRSRQLAIADSAPVEAGVRSLVAVEIDPPPGAVAYRVRVLARLVRPQDRSAPDAVGAVFRQGSGGSPRPGSLYSRLLP